MKPNATLSSLAALALAGAALTLSSFPVLAQQQSPVVKFGIVKLGGYSTAMVAEQEGMFKKYGVNVELIDFRNAGDAIAANRSGHVDVITQTPGNIMQANEKGFDLVALLQNETAKATAPDSGAIVVLKDSEIKNLTDLAGKRMAVSLLAGQNTVAAQTAMKNGGLDYTKVTYLEVPLTSASDTLKNRQVEAVSSVDPFTTQMLKNGVGRVISWTYIESVPEQPLGIWTVRKGFIEKNPDVAARVAKALTEAIDYMNADPVRARQKVAEFTGLDPALIADMPLMGWSYDVHPQRWQAVVDMMATTGALGKDHKAEEYLIGPISAYVKK